MKFFFVFLFLLLTTYDLRLCAQPQMGSTDELLAYQYYQDKQYDKAIAYYQKIFPKNPTLDVYHFYLDCLIKTNDYKTAEKIIKKEMKLQTSNCVLYVDLGSLYLLEKDEKQAKDSYNKAIDKLQADRDKVLELGKAFEDLKQWEYALQTYNKGKTLLKDSYPFLTET